MYNPSSFGAPAGGNSEIERYIYVHVKLLNFVEVAYIENKIDDDTYRTKTSGLMTKIQTLRGQIPNFKVDEFFLNYGLQSLNFAYSKLVSSNSSGSVEKKYQMQMIIYDKSKNFLLKMEAKAFEDPSIRHFTTDLAEIVSLLQRARDENLIQDNVINGLGNNLRTHSDQISRRDINDLLTKDEIQDLCILVDDITKNLKRIMNINI